LPKNNSENKILYDDMDAKSVEYWTSNKKKIKNKINFLYNNNNKNVYKPIFIKHKKLPVFIKNIIDIINLGYEKNAVLLFSRLAMSPKYCDIVLNGNLWEHLLKLRAPNLHNIYQYCLFYAHHILRFEQVLLKHKAPKHARFLIKLSDAYKLPRFETDYHLIHSNSYDYNNINSLKLVIDGNRKNRYLLPPEIAHKRLEIFTDGVLKHVKWKDHCAFLTGSVIPLCILRSQLEDNYVNKNLINYNPQLVKTIDMDNKYAFINYMESLYPSKRSLYFTNHKAYKIMDTLEWYNGDFEKPFITDIDIGVYVSLDDAFPIHANNIFEDIKKSLPNAKMEKINSHKFAVFGANRPIEIFRIYRNATQFVRSFHVDMVKGYYDGEFKMTEAAYSSLVSGVGTFYNWNLIGKRSPIVNILRYMERGMICPLNFMYQKRILDFIIDINPIFKYSANGQMKIFGQGNTIRADSVLFNPRHPLYIGQLIKKKLHPNLMDQKFRTDDVKNGFELKFQQALISKEKINLSKKYSVSIYNFDNNNIVPPDKTMIDLVVDKMT